MGRLFCQVSPPDVPFSWRNCQISQSKSLSKNAMAELFGVTVPNISYHFKRIFASGELDAQTVIKEILITAQSGVRGVSEEKIRYYNLDAILSLGYRVNSVQATAFRKWATSVLKQYMIKGYAVNQNAVSDQKYEDLKRALGLLENVFGQNLIMAEQQAKELFAVVKVTSADTLLIFPTIAYSITIPELLRGLSL